MAYLPYVFMRWLLTCSSLALCQAWFRLQGSPPCVPLLYAQGYLLQCSNKCTDSKEICYLNCKADASPMLYKPLKQIQSVLGLQMALKQKYPAVLGQPQSFEALCTATCCLTPSDLIAADSPRARWQLCWNQPEGSGQAPEVEPARGWV